MAWDTERTRERIQDAATAEFAQHGLHGTTVERIAGRAGINKERVYNYFGGKQQLFATVLAAELAKLAAAVPLEPAAGDLGDYAGRVFDYHADHPQLMRLLLWEGLAYGERDVPDEPQRAAFYQAKTDAIAAAQRDGAIAADPQAGDLMLMLIGLAAFWHAVPQIARILTATDSHAPGERDRRRAAVVCAARRLTAST